MNSAKLNLGGDNIQMWRFAVKKLLNIWRLVLTALFVLLCLTGCRQSSMPTCGVLNEQDGHLANEQECVRWIHSAFTPGLEYTEVHRILNEIGEYKINYTNNRVQIHILKD